MSLGASDKDKIIRYGVIGGALLVVVVYGYLQLRTPDSPPPVVSPSIMLPPVKTTPAGSDRATATALPSGVVTKGVKDAIKVGTTASQYDPSLRMGAMLVAESLKYSGTGRNIFSDSPVTALAPIIKPIASVRNTGPVQPVEQVYVPPPPPPIDLKFFGTATKADGSRQAFLLHGDDVFLAATGTIVQRRYKIGTISANSVEVEDMTNNNKQNLPLQKN
ncbi:hypothetical protein HDF16_003749 [Granulicella aggregans]|uniref:Uncharacterized protein n=1 Tax=Granulicella aggregans TaxID=474949 RepID=A0A7W8E4Y1_9BACT|nr:hypothetical protein [Granulicella aggregans]MBB5059026.1 hypothetical protein [Granulicella aggregans]